MSISLINQYYKKVEDLIRYSGKDNEAVISREFEWLINAYCEKRKLRLVPQFEFKSKLGTSIRPDGTIKNDLRLDYGYWESKANVDLEKEIQAKFNAGYPKTNILFEDGRTAILYQEGERTMVADLRNAQELDKILSSFTTYEHPEVKSFNKAVENFKNDIPKIVEALREMIDKESLNNAKFKDKRNFFWDLCKNAVNPNVSLNEINEMLIQHILTEEIFISIFSDAQFHQENNIAKELYEVEKTFFVGSTKRELLGNVRNYYEMIKAHATGIVSHTEKQTFLKSIYENFYKAYNPKGADRLGIVYTPSEIVKFMIESTDYLLEKHFGKTLADKNVEILDPATGTGTYICDLLEYIPAQYLDYKYKHEIHANEVAILPYYIANLNIEYVFQQKMGYYAEFQNICFVDTLDNTGGLKYEGKQFDMFGFSVENAERIKRQNEKKISVIIGNPPYNAKQENFNDQNANRSYKQIDKRIKDTYIKQGTAQNQIVVYDMYTRFFRWAMDRVDKNGIVAFITNRSFIDSRAFDGFRKSIQEDFSYCYIIDTKSDVRANPKIAGTTHNVFGIQTGVAIMFLVKKENRQNPCRIKYLAMQDEWRKEEKLQWLRENSLHHIAFEKIMPDEKNNWINLSDNDFDSLLPLIDKEVKAGKKQEAVFLSFNNGVETGRDEWLYDFSEKVLADKIQYYINHYNTSVDNNEQDLSIKWNRDLKGLLNRGIKVKFDKDLIIKSHFRPYIRLFYYADKYLNYLLTVYHYETLGNKFNKENKVICITGTSYNQPYHCLATKDLTERHFVEKSQCLPLYCYPKGERVENITDWALEQFRAHYKTKDIGKESIFCYIYAVLHNPAYRQKYELNLKRDFPRIPFYNNFGQWAAWGKELMDLHIGYETIEPYPLVRKDIKPKEGKPKVPNLLSALEPSNPLLENADEYTFVPKAKLKADKEQGLIMIDDLTTLMGVPVGAWEYKLGNRCALEWVLDQYKEGKPSDPTIAEWFNTYRFADYKEFVIDLLMRVCRVSVETMRIVDAMKD